VSVHPTERLLCVGEGAAQQARPGRRPPDRTAEGGLGRKRQGLWAPVARQAHAEHAAERGKLHDDLLDQGESACLNRVARLTRLAGITAQIGYKRRPGTYGGKPSVVVDNTLDRQFDVEAPDKVWVTDITYIRTQEGFAYLAVVIDLFSRRVVGWCMRSRQTTDVVLQALLMATWRRKPKAEVLIHSDQGSQFTSMDWATFLKPTTSSIP